MVQSNIVFPAINGRVDHLKILIVSTMWNDDIVSSLVAGAKESILSCGLEESQITHLKVAGSWELVMGVKMNLDGFDAVIPIGVLIKGSTMHFEYISESVSKGLMDLCLQSNVPILYGVLNCLNVEQARERAGLTTDSHNHGNDWGSGAVRMAIMKTTLRR